MVEDRVVLTVGIQVQSIPVKMCIRDRDYVVSDDISTRDDEIMTDIRAQLVKLTPDEKQYFYHMIVGYIQLKGENAATKTLRCV